MSGRVVSKALPRLGLGFQTIQIPASPRSRPLVLEPGDVFFFVVREAYQTLQLYWLRRSCVPTRLPPRLCSRCVTHSHVVARHVAHTFTCRCVWMRRSPYTLSGLRFILPLSYLLWSVISVCAFVRWLSYRFWLNIRSV